MEMFKDYPDLSGDEGEPYDLESVIDLSDFLLPSAEEDDPPHGSLSRNKFYLQKRAIQKTQKLTNSITHFINDKNIDDRFKRRVTLDTLNLLFDYLHIPK